MGQRLTESYGFMEQKICVEYLGSVNGTTSNRVVRLHGTENMCRVSARRDRSPLR